MKFSFFAFLISLFFAFPASNGLHSQDLATALAAIQQAEQSFPQTMSALDRAGAGRIGTLDRYFKKSVSSTINQFRWKKLKWNVKRLFGGQAHTYWCITYADGFQAYNNFRSYRTPENVAAYYLGQGGGGSWYYQNGQKVKGALTYRTPESALYMFQRHGNIVRVSFYKGGQWVTLQNSPLYTARSNNSYSKEQSKADFDGPANKH